MDQTVKLTTKNKYISHDKNKAIIPARAFWHSVHYRICTEGCENFWYGFE